MNPYPKNTYPDGVRDSKGELISHDTQRIFKIKGADGNDQTHVETVNYGPSMTQQQFKDECDINNIMKRYSDTGHFTHVTSKEGRYADFSMITDYQSMLDTVLYAQEAFSTLPADVRSRFRNDPKYLLDFLQDPQNAEEAFKLGLTNQKPIPPLSDLNNNDLNDDPGPIAAKGSKGSKSPKTPSSPPKED